LIYPKDKIILDLCGGTGAWSKPYADSGYTVINITLPYYDLLDEKIVRYCISLNPYGILFAVECTPWANSGARWFDERSPREIFYYSKLLVKGLRIIMETNSVFWCIENPVGKMKDFLGNPIMTFNPFEFGDPYTKKTNLWGKFNIPVKNVVEPLVESLDGHTNPIKRFPSKMHLLPPTADRKTLRSITPSGFAKAFYEVNQ